MGRTFKIYSLGCKVNQYDSTALAREMAASGLICVDRGAGIAIVNSCSVTQAAIIKNKRMIKKAKKENPKAKIILIGCWARVHTLKKEDVGVDLICKSNGIESLINEIKNQKSKIKMTMQKLKNRPANFYLTDINSTYLDRSRYFIKVQDGCEQFCTYCVIPYARGRLRSREADEIIEEVRNAIANGFREVVLCGIHLGKFKVKSLKLKVDTKEEVNRFSNDLVFLLHKLVKIKDLGRIRLSSIEVNEVTDDLIRLMARDKKLCRHLHIPLQSGCDKILKLMNRPYSKKEFRKKIKDIRKHMPDIALTTDVITGFPGETRKDFDETKAFIKESGFSRLHIFPFSVHEKAPASKLPGRLEARIIKERTEELRALGQELNKRYVKELKGSIQDVAVERNAKEYYQGKTEYYIDMRFRQGQIIGKNKKPKKGEIVQVKMI